MTDLVLFLSVLGVIIVALVIDVAALAGWLQRWTQEFEAEAVAVAAEAEQNSPFGEICIGSQPERPELPGSRRVGRALAER